MDKSNNKEVVSVTPTPQSNTGFTYKSNRVFRPIPPSTVDISFFKKLYAVLKASTNEIADYDIAKLVQPPGQTTEDFEGFKQYAKGLYKVTIHIYGSRGEYIFTENPGIFDDPSLPDKIDRIILENSTRFRVTVQKEPVNQFRITFDFTAPPTFDFNISPSVATPINSSIDIVGENETWVSGTYRKVWDLLDDRRNSHGWLHKNNIWDLFLWIIIMPAIFRIIYLIQKVLPTGFLSMSGVLKGAFYIYAFFILLNLFRIIFSYARWVFPYLELNTPMRKTNLHRFLLSTIVLSIIGSICYELTVFIFKILRG